MYNTSGMEENSQSNEGGHNYNIHGNDHEINALAREEAASQTNESHCTEQQGETNGSDEQDGDISEFSSIETLPKDQKPLFVSHTLVTTFTVWHIIAKPIVLIVNIVYLVKIGYLPFFIIDNPNSTMAELQFRATKGITNFCIQYETSFLITGPMNNMHQGEPSPEYGAFST